MAHTKNQSFIATNDIVMGKQSVNYENFTYFYLAPLLYHWGAMGMPEVGLNLALRVPQMMMNKVDYNQG